MKLSKSKLALAKVINENGGWVDGTMQLATSNKNGSVYLWSNTPRRIRHVWDFGGRFTALRGDWRKLQNWHQTVLSREEYYHAHPKADADGWIEWRGGECPVGEDDRIDVKFSDGDTLFDVYSNWDWSGDADMYSIIAYRLHKPDAKPEFCESVMRSIPDPESIDGLCAKVTEENKHQHVYAKPTIEQLAQDYRNKLDLSNRKQQEADDAKAAADAALGELERAGEVLGILIGIAKSDREPELVITDWRDLKVGDVVEITGSSNNCWKDHSWQEMTVKDVYPEHGDNDDQVYLIGESGDWCLGGNTTWRFIRRP